MMEATEKSSTRTVKMKRKRDNKKENLLTKRHSSDEYRDVAVAKPRKDKELSFDQLRNAPSDIFRVQNLISHLILVGSSTTTDKLDDDTDDSGDEVTHAESTLNVLHDQCHAMLKGLQSHLELLFHHFEYRGCE